MRHAVPTRGRSSASFHYRPRVLELEVRLPLGDTALGVLAAASLLDTHAASAAAVRLLPPGEPRAAATGVAPRHSAPFLWSLTRAAPRAEVAFATTFGDAVTAPDWGFSADAFPAPPRRSLDAPLTSPPREQGADASPLLAPRAGDERITTPPALPQPHANGNTLLATLAGIHRDEPTPAHDTPPAQDEAVRANFARLPLSFESNVGQAGDGIDFLARGPGYTLGLSAAEATMLLQPPQPAEADDWASGRLDPGRPSHTAGIKPAARNEEATVVRMQVLGGNAAAPVEGVGQLPGVVNYFLGNDPNEWHTGIATYEKVLYRDVYAGIDLAYYGSQDQLEYDFIVHPGADPNTIRLGFAGAERVELDADGALLVWAGGQALRQAPPVLYQEAGGVRQEVAGRFVLEGTQVGFAVGAYDAGRPLVIDPVLSYSTYLGGSGHIPQLPYGGGDDAGWAVAVDPATGDALLTGVTRSASFPTANPLQPELRGNCQIPPCSDAFVARLRADGSALIFSTYLGGSVNDAGVSLAVDTSGNASVTGETFSTDFPTVNALQPVFGGGDRDAFVARLTADGRALDYATYLGGGYSDRGAGIAVDGTGTAVVAGDTNSLNFPTVNPLQPANRGGLDAFIARLSADGSALDYATYLGGRGRDYCSSVALDGAGNIFIGGSTLSNDFPTANPLQPARAGDDDAFVARLSADGRTLDYATYFGGTAYDAAVGVAVDASGNASIAGLTFSSDFPTANPLQPSNRGGYDAFIARLTVDGQALVFSTYLGGSAYEYGQDLAVDPSTGDAFLIGWTLSNDLPTVNPLQPTCGGCPYARDAFVARLRGDGSALLFSSYLGGSGWDTGLGVAVDPTTGAALLTGSTQSTNFPTANAFQGALGGTGVYRSTMGGGSWNGVSTGLTNGDVRVLAVNPLSPGILYAGTWGGGVFWSTNGGASWTAINNGLTQRQIERNAFSVAPSEPMTLYAGTWGGGVFRSADGGDSWSSVNNGLTNLTIHVVAVDRSDANLVYAGSWGGGVFTSSDGGQGWREISNGLTNRFVRMLAVDPTAPAVLYAGTSGGGVFKTTDGGATWRGINSGLTNLQIHVLAIDPVNANILYAGTQIGVFKSTDGGSSWSRSPSLGGTIFAIVIHPATSSTIYAATMSEGVIKSTNSGNTWCRTGLAVRVQAVALNPATPSVVYAGIYTPTQDAFLAKISPRYVPRGPLAVQG